VRIQKESQRATGTHQLSSAEAGTSENTVRKSASEDTHVLLSAEGGTTKDTERKSTSEGNSLSIIRRKRDKLGNRIKAREQWIHTSC
jgi:hypothetical protein